MKLAVAKNLNYGVTIIKYLHIQYKTNNSPNMKTKMCSPLLTRAAAQRTVIDRSVKQPRAALYTSL